MVKLPSGNWINPEAALAIEILHNPLGYFSKLRLEGDIEFTDGPMTEEEAEAATDRCAAFINAACAGSAEAIPPCA